MLKTCTDEGTKDCLEILCKNGAEVNRVNDYGRTALMFAAGRVNVKNE